jgi:dienelactone hydrolase
VETISETVEHGVCEREFRRPVEGDAVPGVMWLPAGGEGPRTFVLLGHGGLQHKRAPNIVGLARQLVRHQGYGVVALDAPGHGARSEDPDAIEKTRLGLVAGEARLDRGRLASLFGALERHAGEWRAIVDDLESAELTNGRIGYWGVSMGTAIGLPLTAREPRINAAVFGLSGLREGAEGEAFAESARRLSVPVLFLFQWHDNLMTRESGLALFDAIGSKDKSMHINPGGHVEVPLFERAAAEAFYVRTLTEPAAD